MGPLVQRVSQAPGERAEPLYDRFRERGKRP
jgi:hypothetical protein